MTRGTPGSTASASTPITSPVNFSGTVPLLTVSPVTCMPAFTWETGYALTHGVPDVAAGTPSATPEETRSASTANRRRFMPTAFARLRPGGIHPQGEPGRVGAEGPNGPARHNRGPWPL
jgi:hypothetical protein